VLFLPIFPTHLVYARSRPARPNLILDEVQFVVHGSLLILLGLVLVLADVAQGAGVAAHRRLLLAHHQLVIRLLKGRSVREEEGRGVHDHDHIDRGDLLGRGCDEPIQDVLFLHSHLIFSAFF